VLVTGGWRSLCMEELHSLYASPSITRIVKSRMKWVVFVMCMGTIRNEYKILVEKPEGKRHSQNT